MNEVEIPLKLTGIAAIKAELKDLKDKIADSTDPEQIAAYADRAGDLQKKLMGVNKQIAKFKEGSNFDQAKSAFSDMQNSIMNLDFAKASKDSANFNQTIRAFKPDDLTKQAKGFGSTILNIGKAFVSLGATLMANPIFLLVAVIVAIVAAIIVFLDKIGVLQKAIDFLMKPVNMLIDLFKELTDWLGLTSHAADANAEKMAKANEKASESSKKRAESISAGYDQEIAMAQIAGKDTTQLELDKSRSLEKEAIKRKASAKKALDAMRHQEGEDADKKRKELKKQIEDENKLIRDGVNSRLQIKAKAAKEESDKEKEAADEAAAKAKEAYEKARERAKTEAANRLKNARELKDYELSLIQDQSQREIAIAQEKYKRLREDLKADNTKTAAEKLQFINMYNEQEKAAIDAINAAKKKAEEDNLRKGNALIADLQLQLMEEGTAKELAMQKAKYDKLREGVKNDITLTEEQKKTLTELYNQQEQQEDDKRAAAKKKQQETMLQALQDQQLTDHEKSLKALETKYNEELKLAENNEILKKALTDKYKTDKEKLDEDAAKAAIDAKQKERDAIISAVNDIFNVVSGFAGSLIKNQKKLEKFNKATALVQIGIDTAKAISSLVALSNANPFNSVTAGAAGAAQYASGIIQIATNIMKAKQILSSGGTPSAGGGGTSSEASGGASVAQQVPQGAQLFGSANTGNTFSAGSTSNETQTSMTVTAVVSETQITNVQHKINKINKNAEL
jgi:hypothetical protein